jgi:translation initiation factor eIF-2B subunit gamma
VLSCDSFTTLPPTELLNFHEAQKSDATALFFDAAQNEDLVNLKLKGPHLGKKRITVENDNSLYVAHETTHHRLLFVKSAIDVHESLDIRTSLLWRYPRMNLSMSLQDSHIYIFKRWVVDFIRRNEKISSLRTDLIPVLAKMQWQSNLRKREGIEERTLPNPPWPQSSAPAANSQSCINTSLPHHQPRTRNHRLLPHRKTPTQTSFP